MREEAHDPAVLEPAASEVKLRRAGESQGLGDDSEVDPPSRAPRAGRTPIAHSVDDIRDEVALDPVARKLGDHVDPAPDPRDGPRCVRLDSEQTVEDSRATQAVVVSIDQEVGFID